MNGGWHLFVEGDITMAFSPTPKQLDRYEELLQRFVAGERMKDGPLAFRQSLAVLVVHEERWPSGIWPGAALDGPARAAPVKKVLEAYWEACNLEPARLHSNEEPNSALFSRVDCAGLVRILYQSLPEHDPDGYIPLEQALHPHCTRNDALAASAERAADWHGLQVKWPILHEAFQLAYGQQRYATSRAVTAAAGRGARALLQRDRLLDLLVKEGDLHLEAPVDIGSWDGWYFRNTASYLDEMVAAFK